MYCGIIGYPLKKPRSVKLWKNFFKKKKIKCKMFPIEVSPKNFEKKINYLKKDKDFKAAAITMPYKEVVFKKVVSKDKFSDKCKSVNLIVNNDSKLNGYNTDVYGAIEVIKKIYKKNILIYGYGGTGKAIFKNLLYKYKSSNFVIISKKKIKINKKNVLIQNKVREKILKNINLFINCSPRGSNLKKTLLKSSPLKDNEFKFLNKSSTIFDIVYSPKKTKLYFQSKKNKINYINGLKMNTLQANKSLKIISKIFK